MARHAFLLRIDTAHTEEYLSRHEAVWPDLIADLRAAGWNDYEIFLDRPSGLLVGFVDAENFAAAQETMRASAANTRWSDSMEWMFVPIDEARGVGALSELELAFRMNDQP